MSCYWNKCKCQYSLNVLQYRTIIRCRLAVTQLTSGSFHAVRKKGKKENILKRRENNTGLAVYSAVFQENNYKNLKFAIKFSFCLKNPRSGSQKYLTASLNIQRGTRQLQWRGGRQLPGITLIEMILVWFYAAVFASRLHVAMYSGIPFSVRKWEISDVKLCRCLVSKCWQTLLRRLEPRPRS